MMVIELDDPPCKVRVQSRANARRFTLRLGAVGEGAFLTQPVGVPQWESEAFVREHAGWLRTALARQPGPVDVIDGAVLPVDGRDVTVAVVPGPRRAPRLEHNMLVVQGAGAPGPRVAAWLKSHGRDRLAPAAEYYAGQLRRRVTKVTLRDTRSRWGSCSSRGALAFSWRLAMAPTRVQDYVAAHEAAHLKEMNHSPKFWALVEDLMPDWRAQREWLRKNGRDLHRYRF